MSEPTTVNKPWGHELIWARTDRYVGKILHINQGESLSLQYHEVKEETIMRAPVSSFSSPRNAAQGQAAMATTGS